MRLLAFALVLTACSTSNPDYPPPSPLDGRYTDCSESDPCVVVELGCCDACNGGTAVAVNTSTSAEVRSKYSESCGGDYACTEMACPPLEASCVSGSCVLEEGSWE